MDGCYISFIIGLPVTIILIPVAVGDYLTKYVLTASNIASRVL